MSPIVRFDALLGAFEVASFGQPGECKAYLCRVDGTFRYHSEYGDEEPLPDDINDPEKYVQIPHKNELDLGKRLVLQFASEVLPDEQGKIHEMFRRSGAYAHFKDLLERRDALQEWYDYEDKAKREALRAWCADNAIEIEG